jgi:ABC-2 type transport system ATP-binding protein
MGEHSTELAGWMVSSSADSPPGSALLRIESLSKRYGEQAALAGVSFSVNRGEILGLIGPNGAGKTTLLETIAGVLPADEGTVSWHGAPLPQDRRRDVIFYVPDGVRPYGGQYVAQVLSFFAGVYRRSQSDLGGVTAAVGLDPVLSKRVNALSKGYNRRLILALGFLTSHPVLLMDEPFDGFDLRQARDMMTVLSRVAAVGRTLILSIHQLSDAERICSRFVLLANGAMRGAGTLDELRSQTKLAAGSMEDVFLALT